MTWTTQHTGRQQQTVANYGGKWKNKGREYFQEDVKKEGKKKKKCRKALPPAAERKKIKKYFKKEQILRLIWLGAEQNRAQLHCVCVEKERTGEHGFLSGGNLLGLGWLT